jgi:hypothetical protein
MPQLRGSEAETFEEIKEVDEIVHKDTEDFFLGQPVITVSVNGDEDGERIAIDLKTLYVLAAVSGINLFIQGGKGKGKSKLTEGMLNSMFGEDHSSYTMNTQFSIDMLFNTDVGQMQSREDPITHKMLPAVDVATASNPTSLLTAMAVREDEHGRAPPQINAWEDWHSRDIVTGPGGRQAFPGIWVKDGRIVRDKSGNPIRVTDFRDKETLKLTEGARPYQFVAALSNSGEGYIGVFELDEADADRYGVVVSMDELGMTSEEKDMFAEKGDYYPKPVNPKTSARATELIISLNKKIESLPLSEAVTTWLKVLQQSDHCTKSPYGSKEGLEGFDPTSDKFCKSCNAAGTQGICGHVGAPSTRAIGDMRRFSKALAAYRIAMAPDSPHYVMDSDVTAAGKLLFAGSRMKKDRQFALDMGNGSLTNATEQVLKARHQLMRTTLARIAPQIEEAIKAKNEGRELVLSEAQNRELIRAYEGAPSLIPSLPIVKAVGSAVRDRDRGASKSRSS